MTKLNCLVVIRLNLIQKPTYYKSITMLLSFRLAIFLGAGLLFLIQPMFAKMVLPMLGGSPAVWNTCMLFFQGMLLAGYAYAHLGHKWLGAKGQIILHLVLLVVVTILPAIAVSNEWSPPDNETPIFWLLGMLFVVVGAPFFAVSATSPLLQQWFAGTTHERADNPYFLYSASNFGSIIALLAYPFVLERILTTQYQSLLWKYTYIGFVAAMAVCGAATRTFPPAAAIRHLEDHSCYHGVPNFSARLPSHLSLRRHRPCHAPHVVSSFKPPPPRPPWRR